MSMVLAAITTDSLIAIKKAARKAAFLFGVHLLVKQASP